MELKRCSHTTNVVLQDWQTFQHFSLKDIRDKFCFKADVLLQNNMVYDIDKQCNSCQDKCNQVLSLSPNKWY